MHKTRFSCLSLINAVCLIAFAYLSLNPVNVYAAITPAPTPVPTSAQPTADCGETFSSKTPKMCTCQSGEQVMGTGPIDTCCGWAKDNKCYNNSYFLEGSMGQKVTQETIDSLNPLVQEDSEFKDQFRTPAGILNRVLDFAFPIAGLILFVMIVFGGFEMLTGAANKKNIDQGKQRVTAAIIGFLLLFASFWLVQIMEKIFGVRILN